MGKTSAKEVKDWLKKFHQTVNKLVGNQHLQFTAEIWMTKENPPNHVKEERVQIVTNDELPFLDMKMSWAQEGDLQFSVFRKRRQKLKYVGK